jgi:hypothetical protein
VDIESINRSLEDSMFLNRAHSVGHVAQTVDLIGFGLMLNAVSVHRHRKRRRVEAAA